MRRLVRKRKMRVKTTAVTTTTRKTRENVRGTDTETSPPRGEDLKKTIIRIR